MVLSVLKYVRGMDYYIIVKDFFQEFEPIVTDNIGSIILERRNHICAYGCITIALAIAGSEILQRRVHNARKFNYSNLKSYLKHHNKGFRVHNLKKSHLNQFMSFVFFNSFGMITLATRTFNKNSFVLFNLSNWFACLNLFYHVLTLIDIIY